MSKDDATWLNVAYITFALIVAYVLFKALEFAGLQTGWIERFEWWSVSVTIFSVIIGISSAYWLRSGQERNDYFLASISELRKVSWPTFDDTKRMTIVVCIVVGVFAVILGVFDVVWARALKVLLA